MRVAIADEFAAEIPDGATIAFTGNASIQVADALMAGIERRFLATGHPRGLTLLQPCNAAISEHVGVGRFAHEGLLRRIITSTYPSRTAKAPRLIRMVLDGEIEGYMFPMGVLYNLLREIGAGRPGLLTDVGIGTFVDPEHGGGKLNDATTEDLVERVIVGGRMTLFYKAVPVHVTLLKATTADAVGSLTMEREPLRLAPLSLALAAKASGGKVFAQVERIARPGTLDPYRVVVPGALVDGLALVPDAPQSSTGTYDDTITGEYAPVISRAPVDPGDSGRIILARAAASLKAGWIINLGVGIGDSLPRLLYETGCEDLVTATTEHGGFGGLPKQPPLFGAHVDPVAVLDPTDMFNFYTGGGLDATFLGMAEADATGNVNVSWFGQRLAGAGGFIDIAHATPRIFICGEFAAKGARTRVQGGKLLLDQEGAQRKLVRRVQHVTLNGQQALRRGQMIMLITERATFRLTPEGWVLEEIAPGIDPARDLQPMMDFELRVSSNLKPYPEEVMGQPGASFSVWLRRRIELGEEDR